MIFLNYVGGCGNYTERAVKTWLAAGGVRLDCATSYQNQIAVGALWVQFFYYVLLFVMIMSLVGEWRRQYVCV